jgi:hypothetical protein
MQIVEHQIIYSPERKKYNGYTMNVMINFFYVLQLSMITILALWSAGPPSSCPEWPLTPLCP